MLTSYLFCLKYIATRGCARSIHNELFNIMQRYDDSYPNKRLPYSLPHLLTAPLRALAAKINDVNWVSAWSGIDKTKLKSTTIAKLIHGLLRSETTLLPHDLSRKDL